MGQSNAQRPATACAYGLPALRAEAASTAISNQGWSESRETKRCPTMPVAPTMATRHLRSMIIHPFMPDPAAASSCAAGVALAATALRPWRQQAVYLCVFHARCRDPKGMPFACGRCVHHSICLLFCQCSCPFVLLTCMIKSTLARQEMCPLPFHFCLHVIEYVLKDRTRRGNRCAVAGVRRIKRGLPIWI